MKRWIIFIMLFLIFLSSIGIGYFYLNTRTDQKKESKSNEVNIIKVENNIEEETVSTETEVEEKISPNAHITKTVFYKGCGHEIVETEVVQSQYINMSQDEFEEVMNEENYVVEEFSDLEISLYKEDEGICPEHYVIGEENGFLNIYKIDSSGETILYEVTNIYLEYLPEEEKEQIKNKIEVLGKEDLNLFLENLDS